MSDRGSILISTANDIGEALVGKLGGEGYAPAVWDKEYNKLGIAEVDSAPALSVLEDSSETGTARGSILLSTANAIGAMLNKKYNTDRGFKPKEWASAGRKMKPLETDTKSGSIVNIQGAKETPLLSLVATISPTSSGVSSVTEMQTGKTVFLPMDIEQGTISGSGYNSDSIARIRTAERKAVSPSTLYKIKVNSEVQIYEVHEYTDLTGSSTHLTVNASEYTFTTKSTTNYLRILFRYSNNATIRPSAITELQVTDGALCWNTYTADLGRTIYGGSVDLVNGTGTDENGNDFTFDAQDINASGDVENYYTSAGDTSIEYYAAPTPYTRGTASGAIANVQSARTDLPFTMVKANIAPNLTGVESVEVTKAGKNLFDKENPNEVDGYITTTGFSTSNTSAKTIYIPIVAGATYTVSKTAGQRFSLATAEVIPSNNAVFTSRQANNTATSISITAGANDKYLWAWIYLDGTDSGTLEEMISSVQIEVGSSATEYTPYEEPTVYTADLGEPVYGGYADLVRGTGLKICGKNTFNGSENWSAYTTGNGYAIPLTGMERGTWYTSPLALSYPLPKVPNNDNLGVRIGVNNDGIYVVQANTIEGVTDLTSFKAWLAENPLTIIYPLDVTTEFTFDGQVISPSAGVNNLWNNAGGDTDVEYFEQE